MRHMRTVTCITTRLHQDRQRQFIQNWAGWNVVWITATDYLELPDQVHSVAVAQSLLMLGHREAWKQLANNPGWHFEHIELFGSIDYSLAKTNKIGLVIPCATAVNGPTTIPYANEVRFP